MPLVSLSTQFYSPEANFLKRKCTFCANPVIYPIYRSFRLCPGCLNALLRAHPSSREYAWFLSSVRRALFTRAG